MSLLLFVIVLAVGVGFVSMPLADNRAAQPYSGLLVTWHQSTGPVWRETPEAGWFIVGHGMTLLLLSVPLLVADAGPHAVLAALLCAPMIAMLALYSEMAPFDMAIWADGIVRGRYIMGWDSFSHYTLDDDAIALHSAVAPELVRIVLRPPPRQLGEVLAALRLPGTPRPTTSSWMTRRGFSTAFALSTLPFLVVTYALWSANSDLAAQITAASILAVALLGIRLRRWFGLN